MSSCLIWGVGHEILKEAEISHKQEQKFTDEVLLSLHSVYGEILARSIDLLESGKFTLYQATNGLRKLLKVKSKSEEYTLFYNVNFCSCLAFKYQVLHTKKFITCKHVLAAKLAEISEKLITEIVTPEQISEVLKCQFLYDE